jgi:hypothetical protein
MAINRFSQSSVQNAFPKYNSLWDGVSAAGGMDAISSVIVSSAVSSVTFNSIPSTYTHLQVRMRLLNASTNTWVYIDFAGTSPVYSHIVYGDGATATAGAFNNSYSRIIGYSSGDTVNPGVIITDILDYANTNKTKTVRSLFGYDMNGPTGYTGLVSNLHNSTSAINSLTISCGTNFAQYSSFALYGVK